MSKTMSNHGVLCDRQIEQELNEGNIVIEPFHPEQVSNCSYDVRLGEFYYANDKPPACYNPWSLEHTHRYWGKAKQAQVAGTEDAAALGLRAGDRYIRLKPGQSILAHTQEFIGGKGFITTMMKARSSAGRSNVTVCKCAGWGDIGYCNRWTMEVTNGCTCDVILPVGARIAQIVFFYSSTPNKPYVGKYQGHYQGLDELIRAWTPESMLPKLNLETIQAEPATAASKLNLETIQAEPTPQRDSPETIQAPCGDVLETERRLNGHWPVNAPVN